MEARIQNRVAELRAIESDLAKFALDAVDLTVRMVDAGILTVALENAFVSASVAQSFVASLADALETPAQEGIDGL